MLDSGANETVGEVGRGDITDTGHGLAAECADIGHRLVRGCLVEIVDDDTRTFAREFERDRASDTAAGTRDQGNLTVEFAGHYSLLPRI